MSINQLKSQPSVLYTVDSHLKTLCNYYGLITNGESNRKSMQDTKQEYNQ